jgi:uncharacterized membrane protein
MRNERSTGPIVIAGVALGVGLGGFFGGIVFHQLLQWHHMLTGHGDYPMDTVSGLEVNRLINHQVLGIHHVRDDLGGPIGWDLAFPGLGSINAARRQSPGAIWPL